MNYPNSPPPGRRGAQKGGVVGKAKRPMNHINKDFSLTYHLPPLGYSSSGEEEN